MAECGSVEHCGSSVSDLISWIGCHLHDPDHDRWTEGYLRTAIRLATRQIATDRKDLFRARKLITLQPGCYTDVCQYCPECEDVSPPFSDPDDCENEIQDKEEGSDWADKFFTNISCDDPFSDTSYQVESITLDPLNPCLLKVYPPVPDDGVKHSVYAQCSNIDELCSSPILPRGVRKNILAFVNLVFFFTYSMDAMVNVDITQAQQYLQNYVDLMGLSRQYDTDKLDDVALGQRYDKSNKVGAS